MSRFTKTILSASAAFAITGVALAAPKADLNQDGQITRAEFQAEANAKFAAADTDFDGQLTKDEMKSLRVKRKAEREDKRFAKMDDANGDGVVSRAEYDASTEALFTRMDANGDGVLTKGEGKRRKGRKGKKRRG